MADAACEFGCGPTGEEFVTPGVAIVPACPVHGWMCTLLDERDAALTTLREDVRFERLLEVTERMRQQVLEAGSPVRVHEEDILEAARLVRALNDDA